MLNFGVRPEKQEALRKKMDSLGIREDDILEKFIHGGGKGGQKINKTASAVYLKHLPTGIEVKNQASRSQLLNRFLARRILADKIEEKVLGKRAQEEQRAEKVRRQKRRRSRRAKAKMLDDKHEHAAKKKARVKIPGWLNE